MYLLIFQAWAQLMGFTLQSNQIFWNDYDIVIREPTEPSMNIIEDWQRLSLANPKYITIDWGWGDDALYMPQAGNALMLTNILTHVSMILIFVLIISFFIFLFRIFARMVRR